MIRHGFFVLSTGEEDGYRRGW